MSEYEYRYIEQSVDVRTWKITSPKQLTEDEVKEYGMESNWDKEGGSYWMHGESLVRFDGMEEVKPEEFDILRKARVYVNGTKLPFDYK